MFVQGKSGTRQCFSLWGMHGDVRCRPPTVREVVAVVTILRRYQVRQGWRRRTRRTGKIGMPAGHSRDKSPHINHSMYKDLGIITRKIAREINIAKYMNQEEKILP